MWCVSFLHMHWSYSFREYRPRENVSFLENGTKIFALNPKSFVFLRDMSAGDPEVDLLTTVNIPVVVSVFSTVYFEDISLETLCSTLLSLLHAL